MRLTCPKYVSLSFLGGNVKIRVFSYVFNKILDHMVRS